MENVDRPSGAVVVLDIDQELAQLEDELRRALADVQRRRAERGERA